MRDAAAVLSAYDASAGKPDKPLEIKNPPNPITTLQSQRGNLGEKYDGSAAQNLKPLRRHFETKYDQKKGRNMKVPVNG